MNLLKEGKQRLIWLFHSLQSFKWIGLLIKCVGWLVGLSSFWHRTRGISWRNHPVSKIWIVVYQKKASRDWSDCCTLYKVSNQFEYGLIALLGWKRSNVLFSHCTSTDVAFIRFGLDCKQKSADASQPRGCWTFFPMNHSIEYRNLDGDFWCHIE